jgi:hypothetical protein
LTELLCESPHVAKAYSLASWNVEHFRNPDSRVERVVDFLVDLGPPDVFALYEVEGKEVFDALVSKVPGYTFHITEGPQVQEIMIGVKSSLTAFFTQKTEFKSGLWALRPGALLTLTIAGEPYPILFLHTKSGVEPLGLGLRDDMLNRALDFKKVLEKAAPGPVNYLFLGDLNTMGMEYKYLRERDIEADQEVLKISRFAAGRGMRLLTKDEAATWWGGPNTLIPPSNLDQVVAAEHMEFKNMGGAEVTVLGWPKEGSPSAQREWIDDYSDHGCLYLEVQKVNT